MVSVRFIALFALALSACSFDRAEHDQACERDGDCAADARCYEGLCIERERTAALCTASSQLERCYEGQPAESADVGSCKAGQRICIEGAYSECLGQVLPGNEVCNGQDDDCDGDVDDIAAVTACDTRLRGACSEGTLQCREGIEFCQPTYESQTEACNGTDDDCDGATDELATGMCYPSGVAGCALDTDGAWRCNGLCTTGQSSCDGADAGCSGAIVPAEELCLPDSMFAEDEDCDGAVDEICDCDDGDERNCYAGPIGTRSVGICAPGKQLCTGRSWGDCIGQTLPTAETCTNQGADDDCNGVEDDLPRVGSACIADGEQGECRNGTFKCTGEAEPECVGAEGSMEECDQRDQDCDGDPTNGFDFSSSETCGACDVTCLPSQTCCGAACIEVADFQDDPENCGACGHSCGMGRYCCQGDCLSVSGSATPVCACTNDCADRSCCGDRCRDLDNDKNNCGACGRKCGANEQCSNGTCRR